MDGHRLTMSILLHNKITTNIDKFANCFKFSVTLVLSLLKVYYF